MASRTRPVLLALFVLATSVWAGVMLRRLNTVRAQAAAMGVMPEAAARYGDAVAAVRAAMAGGDVTILRLDRGPGRARVALAGPELAVRRMIGRIETGRPALRFGDWTLQPEPGSADRVRFVADAYGVPGS